MLDDSAIKWNLQRATHLLSLLKDSGDDDCCSCGVYVNGIEFTPHVSKCGHMYCDNCAKAGFTRGGTINCGMCQTALTKSDIIVVDEAEGDNGDPGVGVSPPLARLQSGNLTSTKVVKLLEDLAQAKLEASQNGEPPVKSIIFSQWTSMLDLVDVRSVF
jgi:SWI/SNF-related matrix-associated actin-dependent regulator of chromatin subfamily A3